MKNIKNKEIEPYNNISRHACYFFQMLTLKCSFLEVGFGGNLVQGFRAYAWRAVPSFPQITLWGPSLAFWPQPLYQCVLLKNSFILKRVDVTKLWNSTWNSSGKCSPVNKRQINFHNFTDAGFSHTHPYIVHILSKPFQFNIDSLFRFNIRE